MRTPLDNHREPVSYVGAFFGGLTKLLFLILTGVFHLLTLVWRGLCLIAGITVLSDDSPSQARYRKPREREPARRAAPVAPIRIAAPEEPQDAAPVRLVLGANPKVMRVPPAPQKKTSPVYRSAVEMPAIELPASRAADAEIAFAPAYEASVPVLHAPGSVALSETAPAGDSWSVALTEYKKRNKTVKKTNLSARIEPMKEAKRAFGSLVAAASGGMELTGRIIRRRSGNRGGVPVSLGALAVAAVLVLAIGGVALASGLSKKNITLNDNGVEVEYKGLKVRTVADLFTSVEIPPISEGDVVEPALNTLVENKSTIIVYRASDYLIFADGESRQVRMLEGRVRDALAKAGIELGTQDTVEPSMDSPLTQGTVIRVSRVTTQEIEETVVIPHGERTEKDSSLTKGKTKVSREGTDGEKVVKAKVTYKDGVEIEREVLEETVTKKAKDKIIKQGTKSSSSSSSRSGSSKEASKESSSSSKSSSKSEDSKSSSSKSSDSKSSDSKSSSSSSSKSSDSKSSDSKSSDSKSSSSSSKSSDSKSSDSKSSDSKSSSSSSKSSDSKSDDSKSKSSSKSDDSKSSDSKSSDSKSSDSKSSDSKSSDSKSGGSGSALKSSASDSSSDKKTVEVDGKTYAVKKTLSVEITAYTHTGEPTARGNMPDVGTIAVDRDIIPLGSRIYVPGYGIGTADDVGVHGNQIDIFLASEDECYAWGRKRDRTIYILE